MRANAAEFGITLYPMGDPNQGIVHVIGPEQGRTLPGITIVCGDSHTATHGAFGALAFGIGTSEVEHVLATQTLPQSRPKWMAIDVEGDVPRRRHGQGHHPRDHRRDRHRRRHRSRHRVPRPGDRGVVDGRSHDGVQHVDRGGRARRPRRARRHDVRLSRRSHPRPQGRCMGGGSRRLAVAPLRRRRGVGQAGHDRRLGPDAVRHVGHEPRSGGVDRRPHPVTRLVHRSRRTRVGRTSTDLHGSRSRAHRSARSVSTRCSSVRARTVGSRTCVPRPRSSRAAPSPPSG